MKTLSAPTLAALASGELAIVQLIYLGFATPIALNTSTWDLTWASVIYKGAFGLGTISGVTDKPGEVQGITLELFGDTSMISLALDDADVVQGKVCTIRTAIIEAANYTILDAPIEWTGTLDSMAISEDGEKVIVQVTAESKAVDLLRGTPMFYSDSDQRTVNANDGSFRYVIDTIDKPVIWPSKAFFNR